MIQQQHTTDHDKNAENPCDKKKNKTRRETNSEVSGRASTGIRPLTPPDNKWTQGLFVNKTNAVMMCDGTVEYAVFQ